MSAKAESKKVKKVHQKHGKKYREAAVKIDRLKQYSLNEAVLLVKETSPVKFDASVEIHVKLGIDPRQADQQIRGTVAMPHGTGKKVRVIAFCDEVQAKSAKEAGAIEAGAETLIDKIVSGWLDFDVAVATPEMMRNMGKIAKTLGTRGLMPNPKAGTVTPDPIKVVKELLAGRIEYRNDQYGIVHCAVGKVSFAANQIEDNVRALFKALVESRPTKSKRTYVQSVALTSTMGPGIKLDPKEIR
ncbi:MAG: 50S ribosomal protein L1 [Patescibacteria group bacterium]|nr:50S ribosomal protein L1 [Patescibacteria group bacterium]